MEYKLATHTFGPVFDEKSEILILGSFPSVKSREINFYYGHPQNRFWKVLTEIYTGKDNGDKENSKELVLNSIEEKKNFLLEHRIAVWDVIYQCEIKGSSDSSIINVIPNDISKLIAATNISRIYANGGKAYELYMKYCYSNVGMEIIKLPSSSPANAAFGLSKLVDEWGKINCYIL